MIRTISATNIDLPDALAASAKDEHDWMSASRKWTRKSIRNMSALGEEILALSGTTSLSSSHHGSTRSREYIGACKSVVRALHFTHRSNSTAKTMIFKAFVLLMATALVSAQSKATIFSDVGDALQSGYETGQQALAVVDLVVKAFSKENANGTQIRIGVNEEEDDDQDYVSDVSLNSTIRLIC